MQRGSRIRNTTRTCSDEGRGGGVSKLTVLRELWAMMRVNKKYWLAPIIILLVLFGILLVIAKGSALAPFIYPLF